MRTKTVKRHYCDHCGKGGFRVSSMLRHESGCTANPLRTCQFCAMMELVQKPIEELKVALVDAVDFGDEENYDSVDKQAIVKLRELAQGCPACMLAAIRQSNQGGCHSFDFKKEAGDWISEFRSSRYEGAGYSNC